MFLKKFKACGFKSFADEIEINFDEPMVGIVGPNGSGKSNIVDAFKWVLGERSLKQLRGKNSEDIIFFGSRDKKPSMFAEVSLYFDNTSRVLNSDQKEVVVTRKIHRGSGASEYFVNGEEVTLKNVIDIFLDTGLTKGSLGIISQGTISWFVEAKPEDRRTIFEEAAGISRYSKKKSESLVNLESIDKNIHDVEIVVNTLSRNLQNLEKQATKAKTFLEKKEKLKEIELTILVKDYLKISADLEKIDQILSVAKNEIEKSEPQIVELDSLLRTTKEKYATVDKNLTELQTKLHSLYEEISQSEQRCLAIEQELKNKLNSDQKENRVKALSQMIKATEFQVREQTKHHDKLVQELDQINQKREKKVSEIKQLNETLTESIGRINYLKGHITLLGEQKAHDLAKEYGVQSILKNIAALKGISGPVQNLIRLKPEYERAIALALGRSMKFFVATDTNSALRAIDFLKQNNAGRATFLPLDKVQERSVRNEHLDVIRALEGFVDIACNLVKCERTYLPIIKHLLGNIIICRDLDAAVKISDYTYQIYRVISLDGQVVHVAGAISGGSELKMFTTFNIDDKINQAKTEHDQLAKKILGLKIALEKIRLDENAINQEMQAKNVAIQLQDNLTNETKNKIAALKMEYENLTNKTFSGENVSWNQDKIQKKLLRLVNEKETLLESVRSNQALKNQYKSQIAENEKKLNELRSKSDDQKNVLLERQGEQVKKNNELESIRNRIGDVYRLTIENAIANYDKELPCSEKEARNLIVRLQSEIDSLGSINLDSINDVESMKSRYEQLVKQRDELQLSRDEVQSVISDLDSRARADFQTLIDRLNEMLPKTFRYLFGGGTCQIRYSDPSEDVLVTGIDVFANPLGKHISNLNLLSGGEKTLVALSVLFSILRISAFPLVILDEAESALDPANVERFANIIRDSADNTQFIVITHRQGTMMKCDKLLGATMQVKGVTKMFSVSLEKAQEYAESDHPDEA